MLGDRRPVVGAERRREISRWLGEVDDQESIRAIHAGLDAGINFFDTAANYGTGHSEKILGKALAGKRDQVVIATKFGHIINEETKIMYGDDDQILANVRQDCENSLRRLNTDYIDIYQLHAAQYDPEKAVLLMEALEELVTEGKIRWYGWSTDTVDRAEVFAKGEHCTSVQFALNVAHDNPEMRQLCADTNWPGSTKARSAAASSPGGLTKKPPLRKPITAAASTSPRGRLRCVCSSWMLSAK